MRKQSAAINRIRKNKVLTSSPAVPPSNDDNQDPFHNGQTPACRLLNYAIQDLFPEMQQQSKHQTPSSDLGTLLRWKFMKNRKSKSSSLVPDPVSSFPSPEISEATKSSAASKKKRKRKKKKSNSKQDSSSVDGDQEANDERETKSLDQSFEGLDNSTDDQEVIPLRSTSPPSLKSIPSDEKLRSTDGEFNSSVTFFDQIQPQPQYSGESGIGSIPPPPSDSLQPPRTPRGAPPSTLNPPVLGTPTGTPKISSIESSSLATTLIRSPTHEWVPEEGAISQKETPPSDVIKNPLELPFLVTVHSSNGLTTTTIDGSLVSAQTAVTSPGQGPSSLEMTKVLFEEWLDQLVGSSSGNVNSSSLSNCSNHDNHHDDDQLTKDYQSFVGFLQPRLHGASQPLGLPLSELRESCEVIACHSCRQEALDEVEKLGQRQTVALNPSFLKDDPEQEMSVDAAFDYVALEEGHHLPTPVNHQGEDEVEEEADLEADISFFITELKQKKNSGKQLFMASLTYKHLDKLVEQWLPCGIEEEIMVTTSVNNNNVSDNGGKRFAPEILEEDKLRAFQQNVLGNENDVRITLDELRSLGEDLQKEITKVTKSYDGSQPNLDVKAFPIVKKCDELCVRYMEKLQDVLRSATSERSCALEGLQFHLWVAYLNALNKALKACDKYYSQVAEEMADQRGVVPKMFVSAPLRKIFQELVEEKVRIWTELGSFFSAQLTSRVLKEWYTRTVWDSQRAPKPNDETVSLDEKCHQLITWLSGWTDTILGGRVEEIQRDRMTQTVGLLEMLQEIVEPLTKEYATVERFFSADRNRYFANLRSNIVLAHGVKNTMRLVDNNEVESMSTGIVLMWRHVRIMQNRMITSPETPPLPLQLKRWMLQDERTFEDWRHGTHTSPATSYHHSYCRPGRGGKRRLMCVLAGLVYRWLEERCMEWKAEMAEKELLTDFDIADVGDANPAPAVVAVANKPAKSSKKNKKKKTKAVSSTLNEGSGDDNPTEKLNINGKHDIKPDAAKVELESSSLGESVGEEKLNREAGGEQLEQSPNVTINIKSHDDGGKTNAKEEFYEEEKWADIDDYPSSIRIEDEKEEMSAKEYLIARMELLKSTRNGKVVIF